jgi:hypothetical protein
LPIDEENDDEDDDEQSFRSFYQNERPYDVRFNKSIDSINFILSLFFLDYL